MHLTWIWMSASDQTGSTMRLEGLWYPAKSSQPYQGIAELTDERFRLLTADQQQAEDPAPPAFSETATGAIDELTISDRIGTTARRIHFADGSQFETLDNDAIDRWLKYSTHVSGRSMYLHRLESTWKMVALGVVVTVATVFSGFHWGLPAAATRIADALPVSAHEFIGRGTLTSMDRWILEDSVLDDSEQREIRNRFESLVASGATDGFEFKLHFRQMLGVPNAFALPGGDIVITDALTRLVEAPDELDAIMLHEIGHVLERHGMRHVIEASTLSLIVSLAIGDVGGLGQVAAGVPVFLLQSSYSRSSESEADEFAFARMLERGMDPKHFAAIMRRLEAMAGEADTTGDDTGLDSSDIDKAETAPDWFSTHPDSERRARRAMDVSRELQQLTPP